VPAAGLEKREALRELGRDEVAREEHGIESAAEVESLDLRLNRLGVADVREHLRRLVHRGYAIAEPHELPRDPAGPQPSSSTDAPAGSTEATISPSPSSGSRA
jgi:hypothetical protein